MKIEKNFLVNIEHLRGDRMTKNFMDLISNICENEYLPSKEVINAAAKTCQNDMRSLYYSCRLYEQLSSEVTKTEIVNFWRHETETNGAYQNLVARAQAIDTEGWPTEVSLECTTFCNAKCKNCTHEELLSRGIRKGTNVNKEELFYRIRKSRLITLLFAKDEPVFLPVGLGEPLCHPDIFEIIAYATIFFPRIQLTTNASLLTDKNIEQLLELRLETIQVSMSYFNKAVYESETGLVFEKSKFNLKSLFIKRNSLSNGMAGHIVAHIFDNERNDDAARAEFICFYKDLTRKGDVLEFRPYTKYTDNSPGSLQRERPKDSYVPCHSLWCDFMVSSEGNVFPCCIGVWKKFDRELSIGFIEDDPIVFIDKLIMLRKEQKNGFFRNCLSCANLRTVIAGDLREEAIYYPELIEFCKEDARIFLYGAGFVGKKIQSYLKKNGIRICGFLVSEDIKEQKIEGTHVYSFERYVMENTFENDKIIVCAMSPAREEIVEHLTGCKINTDNVFVQNYYPTKYMFYGG